MRPYWKTALFTVVLLLYLLPSNRFSGPVFAEVAVDVGLDTEMWNPVCPILAKPDSTLVYWT